MVVKLVWLHLLINVFFVAVGVVPLDRENLAVERSVLDPAALQGRSLDVGVSLVENKHDFVVLDLVQH